MPFLLTTIAGLSTMIGTIFIFVKTKNSNKIISSSLAFAAGVMSTVSLTDLIPEAIKSLYLDYSYPVLCILIIIFFNIGIFISILIDKLLPVQNELYRVGIFSMVAIIIHNIPEGIATFMAGSTNIALGITLTIAIALHNIPEGISIAVPIYYSTNSRKKALLYTFISGLSELIGAVITFLFLKPIMSNTVMGCLFAIIAGIMLHISFAELIPTSLKYKESRGTLIFFITGVIFMLGSHFIFN